MLNDSLDTIKKQMRGRKGVRVTLRAKSGRRGGYERNGIIDGLYPEVFTVMVKENGYKRRYCFSYSEVLTHHVEIDPCPEPLLSLHPET
ncbi:MAG: Veg family protein [Eubacteriales bacterium]|nr:Veg family protein [Eubacteriales bacterium]